MIIKFIKSNMPYLAGTIAGFPDAKAQAFIDAGIAVKQETPPVEREPIAQKMVKKSAEKPARGSKG